VRFEGIRITIGARRTRSGYGAWGYYDSSFDAQSCGLVVIAAWFGVVCGAGKRGVGQPRVR
jgi:hypothetical protein